MFCVVESIKKGTAHEIETAILPTTWVVKNGYAIKNKSASVRGGKIRNDCGF